MCLDDLFQMAVLNRLLLGIPKDRQTDCRQLLKSSVERRMVFEIATILASVLAVGTLMALLIASIMSARRRPSWHAVCRIIGVSVHFLSLLFVVVVLSIPFDLPACIPFSTLNCSVTLAFCGVVGCALFGIGYFAQVLDMKNEKHESRPTEPGIECGDPHALSPPCNHGEDVHKP